MAKKPPRLVVATRQATREGSGVVVRRKSQTIAYQKLPTKIPESVIPAVDKKYHDNNKQVFASFANTWRGELGRIDDVERRIEFTNYISPFCSALCRAGPDTGELD